MPSTPQQVFLATSAESGWRFRHPRAVLEAQHPDEVLPVLAAAACATERDRLWAVGFLAYEAAAALDSAKTVRMHGTTPLAWFALFKAPERVRLPPDSGQRLKPWKWKADTPRTAYEQGMRQIRARLRCGDTYQVNYTLRLRAAIDPMENIEARFVRLCRAQRAAFGAYIDTPDWALCSASPELFFELRDRKLVTRPMKGTMPRGLWSEQDLGHREALLQSEKERAENLMIVDMARNDCGRIAETGSVRVSHLFRAEAYPTVWQLTSTVSARTTAGLVDIFRALYPAASITGAPKIRTMELIAALESSPRGLYTGCIGFMAPGRRARFSVAIRTLWIDRTRRQAEYGVGGGVVWDSTPRGEWEECRVKARVLTRRQPAFDLLETLRWTPLQGYALLERHLARLAASAQYFGYRCDVARIRARLAEEARQWQGGAAVEEPALPRKVRLLVSRGGGLQVTAGPLEILPRPWRLRAARDPVDANDPFLYHKTTQRACYERARAGREDCEDVLLWNKAGEITEALLANVLLKIHGRWVTPPLRCGLLPGTQRAEILAKGVVREEVVRLADLSARTSLRLVNSVRGTWEATLMPEP